MVPTAMPMQIAPAAAARPTTSETRAPWMSWDSTSRPSVSVPSGKRGSVNGGKQRPPDEVQGVARREHGRQHGDERPAQPQADAPIQPLLVMRSVRARSASPGPRPPRRSSVTRGSRRA